MFDSGSAGNFLDCAPALLLHIPLDELNNPVKISTIYGGPIRTGNITQCIQTIMLQVGCLPQEDITFLLTNASSDHIKKFWNGQHSVGSTVYMKPV